MALVYCHINKINNKKYVGITSSAVERRWKDKGTGYKGSCLWTKGFECFGWDNFIHHILIEDIPIDLAEQVEARVIKAFDLTNPDNGYNESCGARIVSNTTADNLTELICEKILKLNEDNCPKEVPLVDYSYDSPRYSIDFLVGLHKKNQLNTELDCQRGYVWTPERQQGMWDTLLRGHRIPECHAVMSNKNGVPLYEIIDGKQRITTILKIVNNEIAFQKRFAAPMYHYLFTNKTQLYFYDLPIELQNRILNTNINFAIYINISDEDLVVLFRKLNASMALNDFSKNIASCITMRTKFTRYLINHPLLKALFTEKEIGNSDDELFLIRLMYLLKYGSNKVSLQPRELNKQFDDFPPTELNKYVDTISSILDKYISLGKELASLKAKGTYYPFIFYIFHEKNIPVQEALDFITLFKTEAPQVHGSDGSKRYQDGIYNTIADYFSY